MILRKYIANFFIVISLFSIFLVLIWSSVEDYFSVKSPKALLGLVENSVFGIHYQGKSETGDFYNLKAKKIKDLGNEKYHVFKPDLEITTVDNKKYYIISDEMIFEKKENIAHFQGNVDFKNNDDLEIKTPTAVVYIDKNYAEGDDAVECIRGNSKITAIGFKMNGEDGNVDFKTNATVQIIK